MKSDTTEATTATVGNAWTTIPAATALEDQHFNPAKVFVGGLGQSISSEVLRSYFTSRFGQVTDCAIVHDRVTGRSRGFGFVVFTSEESVEACVAEPRHQITDTISCEVRRAVPRDDVRCETSLRSKVFVSGLREDTREATLKHYFGKFGLVQDVCIKLNRSTQRSRGFGFVLFRDAQSAEASLGSHPELGPQVSSGFTGPPTYQSRI